MSDDTVTIDSILGGRIKVVQPRRGYRFSIDSVLLARFVRVGARDRVLELGAGCGVISLIVAALGAPREIDASQFEDRPAVYKRDLGAYISSRDLQQLFVRSIETEAIEDEWGVPFQIFYGISGNTRAFWSIANARRMLGYEPEDDSEVRFTADIQRLLIARGARGRLG